MQAKEKREAIKTEYTQAQADIAKISEIITAQALAQKENGPFWGHAPTERDCNEAKEFRRLMVTRAFRLGAISEEEAEANWGVRV
jgi:hypothetical protein